jgi:hypothetical protein
MGTSMGLLAMEMGQVKEMGVCGCLQKAWSQEWADVTHFLEVCLDIVFSSDILLWIKCC